MSNRVKLAVCVASVCRWVIPTAAQTTGNEFRPELGVYIQQGPQLRIDLENSFYGDLTTGDWRGHFAVYINAALKPFFRRELRKDPNVFRNKYLTMRAGYQYSTTLAGDSSPHENRGILELTSRYSLPWQFVISDRNRGEFRFIEGRPFSTRYRNRLRLERDVKYGWLACTPYVYGEVFYDTRYDLWTPVRYALGIEFPAGTHMVLEPYYLRQNGSHSNPPHVNAAGLNWNLYF
jgi:Protein of unknown function (DUF2490)